MRRLQLGDPSSREERIFAADDREVLIILRKLEEKYGKARCAAH